MTEFTQQFLVEARELAEQASADVMRLEAAVGDTEALESAFRAFHTLKGAAGIMEYAAMERLLHRAEDVLQELRAKRVTLTAGLVDGLLATIGQLVRWFQVIERTDQMPANADADADRLSAMLSKSAAMPAPAVAVTRWQEALLAWAKAQDYRDLGQAQTALRYRPAGDSFFKGEDPLAHVEGLEGVLAVRLSPAEPWPATEDLDPFASNLLIEVVLSSPEDHVAAAMQGRSGSVEIVALAAAAIDGRFGPEASTILEEQLRFLRLDTEGASDHGRFRAAARVASNVLRASDIDPTTIEHAGMTGSRHVLASAIETLLSPASVITAIESAGPVVRETAASTIRVDTEKIDEIVNLTGELLVTKNALGHWARLAASGGDLAEIAAGLKAQQDVLERHLSELQRTVFDLRVLPLERVFSRFPRLVREAAASLGKQVTFITEGADTKADKAVVEALFEPLLHVIRNAIDHGIEPTDARVRAGKAPAAEISLRAWREADQVNIEVADDGRGVDPALIRRLAAARGVADAAVIEAMGDDEAVDLIFAPGFSTAEKVTDLSGRGVGMGAVRSAIERVGGEIRLTNRPGQGLVVRLILPFSIMLTRVMTIEAGGQTFGVPFDAIIETVRIARSDIRPLGAGWAFVRRNETIPVLDLAASLQLEKRTSAQDEACILIVWAGGMIAGLEIDRPGERLDMMMKPADGILAGMPALAGTGLTGNGQVLLVLDLREILE